MFVYQAIYSAYGIIRESIYHENTDYITGIINIQPKSSPRCLLRKSSLHFKSNYASCYASINVLAVGNGNGYGQAETGIITTTMDKKITEYELGTLALMPQLWPGKHEVTQTVKSLCLNQTVVPY